MQKKLFIAVLVIFWIFPVFVGADQKRPTTAAEIRALMEDSTVTVPTADMVPLAKFSVEVNDVGDKVRVTIFNPAMVSTENLPKPALKVKLASGILHAAGQSNFYFANVVVKKGKISFTLPNYAQGVGEPVVEHIWGYAEAMDGDIGFFLLDSENPWVIYQTDGALISKDSLVIGLVMYPDKPTVSLKSLDKGKLDQGRHPELAE